jgi:hypothetical protein
VLQEFKNNECPMHPKMSSSSHPLYRQQFLEILFHGHMWAHSISAVFGVRVK